MDRMCVLLGQKEWAAVRISGKVREDRFNIFELIVALGRNGKSEWTVVPDAGFYSLQNELLLSIIAVLSDILKNTNCW